MKEKRRFCRKPPASPWRGLLGVVVAACLAWRWIGGQAGADSNDLASLPPGQEPDRPLMGMQETISLDLRSTDATDALKYLATKGGLNISISKNVSGRVNLFLTNVPIRDAFDLILRSNELAYDKQGDVYSIMTEDEYRKLYGKKFSDLRQVKAFRLQYAIPQQAFNVLDTLKSEIGRVLVDEDSGTVMVLDTPDKLQEMEQVLGTLEQGSLTKVIDLKYAKAKDIEEQLKEHLEVNKLGYVKADERSNQIIVKTLPERLKEVERLVLALDRKTREVLIDSKIVKVTYTKSTDAGVDWDSVFTNLKFHGVDTIGDFRTASSGTPPSETPAVTRIQLNTIPGLSKFNGHIGDMVLGTVSRDGYELMRYLETLGQTKIISNPRLLVTENQEAKIHVGTREAYVTTTTTTGQTTSTTAEDVQFIDVGIQLSVTPVINRDGFVTMKIKPEVSSVVRTLTTPSKNQIPIVDTSIAETSLMVADGMTVVLGGLRKDEKKYSDKQIPYLGRVPLLGPVLFKQRDEDNELTELVVFITPHIVHGQDFVTGDEGGQLKGYRDYAPVLSDHPSKGEKKGK